MASDVKWIKITTDIFDDEKILLIESLPDAYAMITVWFKLLCLAGKQNNSGVFLMGKIAYTDKMLATIFRMKESTVTMALNTFEQFGMVEIVDGVITIPNWGKHQNLDQMENRKEYMRTYMQEYRAKQRALTAGGANCKPNSKPNVSKADIDIEEDSEEESNINTTSNDVVRNTDIQKIADAWNSLGLSKVSKIVPATNRYKLLKARIKEYGVDSILEAIEKIKASDFLMGRTGDGWTITFDWFIKPNNFPKVLDGNYQNKTGGKKGGRKEIVPEWMERDSAQDDMQRMMKYREQLQAERANNPDLSKRVEQLKRRLQE